ncbi:DUF501 domain-containing protein [Fervidobacterium sp.]
MECISDKDLSIISFQLERKIDNAICVLKRCSYGFPVVILSYPIRDGKPFPTIHYLTCPYLRKEVSKLEERGFIRKYEEIIENSPELKARLVSAHDDVVQKRISLLKPADIVWKDMLLSVGSGGIRDRSTIKCLHLHLADFLAGIDNPAGEMVYNQIEKKECIDGICAGFKKE